MYPEDNNIYFYIKYWLQLYMDVVCISSNVKQTSICNVLPYDLNIVTKFIKQIKDKKYKIHILWLTSLEWLHIIIKDIDTVYIPYSTSNVDCIYTIPNPITCRMETNIHFLPRNTYIIITSAKTKSLFVDVYDSNRIIMDLCLTDEETVDWLKRYGQKLFLASCPKWKVKTFAYITH
jgi:hypothetical protein